MLVEFCLRHGLTLVSDEIHCDLLLDPGVAHTCVAGLTPELPTITLFGPNKSYNIPGLGVGVAVIPDAGLRRAFLRARAGLIAHTVAPRLRGRPLGVRRTHGLACEPHGLPAVQSGRSRVDDCR